MASSEERLKVLKMVADGKITAEVAAELLKALEASTRKPEEENRPTVNINSKGSGRFFRVRVTDTESGRARVNIRLPVGMINAGIRMGMRFSPEVEGLDAARMAEALASGETGKIMDVYDDEDGEHVEVFIE